MNTAKELRKLAKKISELCSKSTCAGVASTIIDNAADHLCAIARIHELNSTSK